MTVPNTIRTVVYTANGATSVFPFPFFVFQAAHVSVTVTSPLGVSFNLLLSTDGITGDFTVSGVLNSSGSVTLLSNGQSWMFNGALISGWQILIARVVPYTQTTNVRGENRYNPEVHENEYDLLMMAIQQLKDQIGIASGGGGGGGGGGSGVPLTRLINTLGPLAGGGSLANDLTLSINLASLIINAGAGLIGGGNLSGPITLSVTPEAGMTLKGNNTALATQPLDLTPTQVAGLLQPIITKTAAYQIVLSDHTILCNTAGGGFTVTAPDATTCKSQIFDIKKITSDANNVTLQGFGGQNIDTANTVVWNIAMASYEIQSDGTQFWII